MIKDHSMPRDDHIKMCVGLSCLAGSDGLRKVQRFRQTMGLRDIAAVHRMDA